MPANSNIVGWDAVGFSLNMERIIMMANDNQIASPMAGEVDILLAPDLDAGNFLTKNLEYLAGVTLAGIFIGAKVPAMHSYRTEPTLVHLVSAAIAVLLYQHWASAGISTGRVSTIGDEL